MDIRSAWLAGIMVFGAAFNVLAENVIYNGMEVHPNRVIAFRKASVSMEQERSQLGFLRVQRIDRYTYTSGAEVLRIGSVASGERSIGSAIEHMRRSGLYESVEPDLIVHADVFPNDPAVDAFVSMTSISAPQAWDLHTGTQGIGAPAVVVIDTGIDPTHPDIVDNLWVNPDEIPGNLIDDDSNGYVDDISGVNFVCNDGSIFDDNSHGTHVAGTIAARGNNGIGVAGVNWVGSLVSCKFLDSAGNGSISDAVKCMDYVAMMKARGHNFIATNNSYGGSGMASVMLTGIQGNVAAGVTFVASAGNNSVDLNNPVYFTTPASYAVQVPGALAVAASNAYSNDAPASFTNFGTQVVHLAAPGVGVQSTRPFNIDPDGYEKFNGTSMAAPHVSGSLALLASYNPSLTAADRVNAILATVDVQPQWQAKVISGGRLNIYQAMLYAGSGGGGGASSVSASCR